MGTGQIKEQAGEEEKRKKEKKKRKKWGAKTREIKTDKNRKGAMSFILRLQSIVLSPLTQKRERNDMMTS